MFGKIRESVSRVRMNLTSLDDQPLSKAALVIILFLDLFILTSIFDGLVKHTRQLAAPDEYISFSCREIVITRDWNPTSRIQNLSNIILWYHNNRYPIDEKRMQRHPVCAPYHDLLDKIKNDTDLLKAFEDRDRFDREAKQLQREIDGLKGAYDTSLLETIAKQREGQANVDKIKQDFQAKSNALNDLQVRMGAAERAISEHGTVKLLWGKIEALTEADRERLRSDLRHMNFWYPVKRLGMQMVFLLPLFLIFYAWNNASIRKGRGIQVLVSAHLLIVSFIPIFFKIIETVYDIIPKKFLKRVIELLESLKLVAIWHYLIIALAVAAALFVIYIFQKKIFSREKLLERRIAKGQCQQCGKHLPAGSPACPFCGFAQFKACGSCGRPTLVFGKYCRECGKAQ